MNYYAKLLDQRQRSAVPTPGAALELLGVLQGRPRASWPLVRPRSVTSLLLSAQSIVKLPWGTAPRSGC